MKNVYIVLHTLSMGGAERHASSIANYLSDHGYRVKIVLLDNNVVDYTLSDSVEVICFPDLSFPEEIAHYKPSLKEKGLLTIYKKIAPNKHRLLDTFLFYKQRYANRLEYFLKNQNDIDDSVVISFMPTPNISTSMAKKNMGFKLILGEFNSPHLEFAPNAPENILKKKYFPKANGFVFQTKEQQSFYTFLDGVKKVIIPNPIEDIKTQPYRGVRKKEIVNFCRLVPVKNISLLVEAFARISKEYPEYKLVVYGEGSDKSKIERDILRLGVKDKVFIKPFEKDVLDCVRDSAMFVSSSDREGISNSMLESMAIGLPVICTDCPAGGARMFIKQYENGILVPVRDPDAMYKAMKYMIDNPELADKMGNKAVEIRNNLNKEDILKQWLMFVNEIGEN